ncbi:helix-turn-helix domain-containing protein [Streptacidiphilus sp. PAMC 29251]
MTTTIRQRRIPPPELGQMLGRARMRADLRGREAARLVGISRQYLVRLEVGQRSPSVAVAEQLAEVLQLTAHERAALMAAAVAKPVEE